MTKHELNQIYEKIVKSIDISDELFDKAENEYIELGKWLDEATPDYKLSIYPQGSFALGTVIKPISDEDNYDLDLVCEFDENYNLPPKTLKVSILGNLLKRYKRSTTLEEKPRCWHVEYERISNFHMDVIPAVPELSYINITNKCKKTNEYEYIGSNPKGYIDWFNSRKKERRQALYEKYIKEQGLILKEQAEIEKIKEYNFKTSLQKAIQLLKRHRDVMFEDNQDEKPISIIITTIAAQLYNNEDNIYDTLKAILVRAKDYIEKSKKNDVYRVENPTNTGLNKENFADKWAEKPNLADAFFEWIESAKSVFLNTDFSSLNEGDLLGIFEDALGVTTIKRVFPLGEKITHFRESNSDEDSTALVTSKVRDILFAPYRQKPLWGKLPKGSRIIILAEAYLPSGERRVLKNNDTPVEKGTYITFTAIYGGIKTNCTIRWQIVNYGLNVPRDQVRGTFEPQNTGRSIREHCEFSGYHGVQCIVTRGSNITLYKSDIFIVNIK